MDDKQLKYTALNGYANWLETGDFCMDAATLVRIGGTLPEPMSHAKMVIVVRLRELAMEVLRQD